MYIYYCNLSISALGRDSKALSFHPYSVQAFYWHPFDFILAPGTSVYEFIFSLFPNLPAFCCSPFQFSTHSTCISCYFLPIQGSFPFLFLFLFSFLLSICLYRSTLRSNLHGYFWSRRPISALSCE
ncbi:hypothetical protein L228DRAFT_95993 [Xylona heveae TC161]|uniref:Uncharacterized protein n=1 Tax=Xylona heveae (strain CBS 132557 / TC161) TaxID=1328760 RepID=A0A165I5E2_XYLHT|nr:hypothetical protein L228DRAFT_95993 [Xylona heveae TC161]KZF24411.1 hypothetical protein L228DRAFT_95993 [Xylona heveae TC161]